ncbi:MAG: hypothetical protein MJE77_39545 [Proteobacteria bacterium]|nr:hypothetical protein [Pseudomonadota bacterium]
MTCSKILAPQLEMTVQVAPRIFTRSQRLYQSSLISTETASMIVNPQGNSRAIGSMDANFHLYAAQHNRCRIISIPHEQKPTMPEKPGE